MATVKPRGRSWELNWSENGQQHRKSLGRVSEAQANIALKEKELELLTGRPIHSLGDVSLRQFLEQYLPWYRMTYPRTYTRTEGIFRCHLLPRFGHYPLHAIKAMPVHAWIGERLEVAKHGTVLKELRALKAALNRAVRWEYLEKNPLVGVTVPKSSESSPPVFYMPDQLEELYRHSLAHHWLWRFYVNTGLRRTEALNLRREHCKDGALMVLSAEGAETKGKTWRMVPLNDKATVAMQELMKRSQPPRVIPKVNPKSITRAFANCRDRAGLPGSLHSLRHTFGSHLVMAGVPLRTVQELMGHKSIETTQIYAHLAPGHLEDSVGRIEL